MVTVGMNYVVREGKEETFEKAFEAVLAALEKGEGHGATHLYRDVKQGSSYLIVSEWNDESAFQSFIQSEAFKKVTNWGEEQILAGRPKHQVYKH